MFPWHYYSETIGISTSDTTICILIDIQDRYAKVSSIMQLSRKDMEARLIIMLSK